MRKSNRLTRTAACLVALLSAAWVPADAARAGRFADASPAVRFADGSPAASSQRRRVRRKARRTMREPAKAAAVAEGVWGGEHVRMTVRGGGADLEFDCAHGEITSEFRADADGRFDLAGTYTPESRGPVRRDSAPSARAARYAGRVSGSEMTLDIKLSDGEQLEEFTLTRGSTGRIFKCR